MTARIAILGSYPPPHGGVANHVYRLVAQLEQRGISFVVYNAVTEAGDGVSVKSVARDRQRWLLEYLVRAEEPIVYILSDRLAVWAVGAALALARGKRVIVRLRNAMLLDLAKNHPRRARLAGALLRAMSGVVAVSPILGAAARALGVPADCVHVAPGFLPPRAHEYDAGALAPGVMGFVAAHEPTLATSGRVAWHEGRDLYGFDMIVELVRRLRPLHPRIGVVVCFFDHAPDEVPRLEALKRRAIETGVEDAILFNTVAGPFLPVLSAVSAFVRPTATDGDANTIREALSMGVPAIASDVASRPAGTVVFRSRDDDDFFAKVSDVLSNAAGAAPRAASGPSAPDQVRIDEYVAFLLGAPAPAPR